MGTHLVKHQEEPSTDSMTMVVAKMSPKIDKLSREDFEDVSPREKKPKMLKQKSKLVGKVIKNRTSKVRLNDSGPLVKKKRRPKISEKARMKSKILYKSISESSLVKDKSVKGTDNEKLLIDPACQNTEAIQSKTLKSSLKHIENRSQTNDQSVNGHILKEAFDGELHSIQNTFSMPKDEINLADTSFKEDSPKINSINSVSSKSKDTKESFQRKKNKKPKSLNQKKNELDEESIQNDSYPLNIQK